MKANDLTEQQKTTDDVIEIGEILRRLPHRYPFLLVDRVHAFADREYIEGSKNISANEHFFQGHFPNRPIMPGVLMLEALAQLGAIFAHLSTGGVTNDRLVVFSGAEDVRFRRPVIPGDVLTLRMELVKSKFGHWKMHGTAKVGDEVAVDGILMATEVK